MKRFQFFIARPRADEQHSLVSEGHIFPADRKETKKAPSQMKKFPLYIMSAILLCSCASESRTTGTAKLSRALVEKNLIKGKTTKAEVRALLGEPQSAVTSDVAGTQIEAWSYTKTFYRDASEKGFGYAVGYSIVNPASGGYDRVEVSILTITFDATGRVNGHTFATSASGMPR